MQLKALAAGVLAAILCGGVAQAQVARTVPNDGTTGTVVGLLAVWTTASTAAAKTAPTTTVNGVIGVVIGESVSTASPALTGNAVIAFDGPVNCTFDGSNTSGNWVVVSTTTAGNCHDSGVSSNVNPPAGAVGISSATNTGAGSYPMQMIPGLGSGGTVTLAGTGQAFSGGVLLTPYSYGVVSTATAVNCGNGPAQQLIDGGAFTLNVPAADGQCTVHVVNGGSFGAVTFGTGWRVGSNTGDTVPTADRASGTGTITIAAPGVVTYTNTLVANDPVYFTTTGALPTGLTAGTVYYVSATGLTTSAFSVSVTPGGTAITTSGTQSGTHTVHVASSYDLTVSRIYGTSTYSVKAEQ